MGKATRAAYGEALKTVIYKNPRVVVLEADLGNAKIRCVQSGCPRTVLQHGNFRTGYDGYGGRLCGGR